MSNTIKIGIPDQLKTEIEKILKAKNLTLSKFISSAIELRMNVIRNLGSNSKLLIENPKGFPKGYSLLIKVCECANKRRECSDDNEES